jgi:phage-related minor tail protein
MSTQLTASLVLKGDASGIVGAATDGSAALTRLSASADAAAASGAAMAPPYNAAAVAIAGQTAASDASTKALTASGAAKVDEIARLTQLASASTATTSQIVALSAAHGQYNSTVNAARALLAAGVISQADYEKAVQGASSQLALATAVHKTNTSALANEVGGAAALKAAQTELGEEAEDAGVHIEGLTRQLEHMGEGAGLGLGSARLLTEGIKDIISVFSSADGVVYLFVGGVVAALGTAIAATASYQASVAALDRDITANANSLHLSEQGYEDLAAEIATTADVSQRSGMTILETLQSAGVNSQSVLLDLASAARAYAAATNTDAVKATQAFASSLKDPVSWAKQLDDQWSLFNATQLQNIENLVNSGRAMQANDLIAQAIVDRMKDAENETSAWGASWDDLTKHMSDYWNSLSKFLAQPVSFLPGGVTQPGWTPPAANDNAGGQSQQNIEQLNQESVAVQNLIKEYNTYGTTLQNLSEQQKLVQKAEADGAISATTAESALSAISIKRQQTIQAEQDALLNLNAAEKMHTEEVKDYVDKTGPQAVAAATADAQALQAQANASDGTAQSIKALQDAYAITKTTLPAVTLLQYAHGAALEKLTADIQAQTAAMKQQQEAQQELDTIQQLQSKFSGMSTIQNSNMRQPTTDAAFIAQTSTQIFNANAAAETEWYTQSIKTLDAWLEAQDTISGETLSKWQTWRDQLGLIFNSDMAKFYTADLARRTDWASGIQRGLNSLDKSTSDWATTSQNLLTGLSNEFEDDFVKMVSGGKDALGDFFQWVEQQLLKLLYQQYLASYFNGLFGSVVGGLGNILGIGGGGAAVAGASGSAAATQFAGVWHSGGTVGDPAPALRLMPLALFEGARRYHSGGLVGPDEVPAILQRGERVLTAAQAQMTDAALSRPIVIQGSASAGEKPPVTVNIHPAPGTTASASQPKRGADGSFSMDVMIQQIDKSLAQRSKYGRSAFTQSLENTHGIKRSPMG